MSGIDTSFIVLVMDHFFENNMFAKLLNNQYADMIFNYSIMLSYILTPIAFIVETYKVAIGKQGNFISVLFRITLVVILLASYPGLVVNANHFINDVSKQFFNEEDLQKLSEKVVLSENSMEDIEGNNESDKNGIFSIFVSTFSELTIVPLLLSLVLALANVIIFVIMFTRNIGLAGLTVIGPLLIPLLILKNTTSFFKGWVQSILNLLLWPVWVGILLYMMSIVSPPHYMQDVSTLNYQLLEIGYNIAFIFLLLSVMRLFNQLQKGTFGALTQMQGLVVGSAMLGTKMLAGKTFGPVKGVAKSGIQTIKQGSKHTINNATSSFDNLRNNGTA